MKNNIHRQILVSEMAPHVHSFASGENKVEKITKWLISWIESSLEIGKICPNDFLPKKGELAYHIGVSQGTVQSVFRRLEDLGYVESKQRIGTYIKNRMSKKNVKKLTSKRELAVEIIKKYIVENEYVEGDVLVSLRRLSKILQMPNTTIQMAISNLVSLGVLKKKNRDFIIENINFKFNDVEARTLVEKITYDIKKYISSNLKTGDRLPANNELSKIFGVSMKTIHDAIKTLAKEGVVYTRRGQYGTIVLGSDKENSEQYYYEKIEHKIRGYIIDNCKVGDKLLSIKEFANKFNTSEKTVKKALDMLAEEGYLMFSRGRYGGTFVTDIPQNSKEAYQWLAISSDYVSNT